MLILLLLKKLMSQQRNMINFDTNTQVNIFLLLIIGRPSRHTEYINKILAAITYGTTQIAKIRKSNLNSGYA